MFLVPGMAHCGGGPALDHFDMLSAVVNWVEKGTAPGFGDRDGTGIPGPQPPAVRISQARAIHGSGDTEDAKNFRCQ